MDDGIGDIATYASNAAESDVTVSDKINICLGGITSIDRRLYQMQHWMKYAVLGWLILMAVTVIDIVSGWFTGVTV